MACKYQEECPCCSGWCNIIRQDYENCIPFLLTAYERAAGERDSCEDKLQKIKEIIKD